MCRQLGIEEMSFYGFTVDNTKRPSAQRQAFTKACVAAVEELSKEDASLLVLGNTQSPMFPPELLPYTRRHDFGAGGMKINFLVNYSWEWDMGFKTEKSGTDSAASGMIGPVLKTAEVSRIDLVIRWGGRRRLSGFLPVQFIRIYMWWMITGLISEKSMWRMRLNGILARTLHWEVKKDRSVGV